MNKETIKDIIIELFKEGTLNLEVDTRRDWMYENWNDEYKIVVSVNLYDKDDNVIVGNSDYFLIDNYITLKL